MCVESNGRFPGENFFTELHGFTVSQCTHADSRYWCGELIEVAAHGSGWMSIAQARELAAQILRAADCAEHREREQSQSEVQSVLERLIDFSCRPIAVAAGEISSAEFAQPQRLAHLVGGMPRYATGSGMQQPLTIHLREEFWFEDCGFLDAPDLRGQPSGSIHWLFDEDDRAVYSASARPSILD